MKITSVEKDPRNENRLLIYVDGKYSFPINMDDYLRYSLYENDEISDSEIERIKDEVVYRSAKAAAIKFMSLHVRSGGEVRKKLKNDGYGDNISESVIDELTAMGYINDRIYAGKFIFDRYKLKPVSKRFLKIELLQKDVDAFIIDEALEEIQTDDISIGVGLVRKKYGKYDLKDEKVIKRIYSFLQHRGFNYEDIGDIIESLESD